MRSRLDVSMPHRATIERYQQTDTGGAGGKEPLGEASPIAEDVPCQFAPRQTMYERPDVGERTEEPASALFPAGTDVQEGDILTFDRTGNGPYEVRGIDESVHQYRGDVISLEAELARAD